MNRCVDCGDPIEDATGLSLYCDFCHRLHTPFRWSA